MKQISGTTALVTGAGSGIGLGIARQLAVNGANVIAVDINADTAERTAREIAEEFGVRALGVACDVTSREAVHALGATAREWGGTVRILCNNAGVSLGRWGIHASHEDWKWVVGVSLGGVIHGIEEFLPDMLSSGEECHVVNTASMNGLFPSGRSSLYSTAKYGIVGLTETMRDELRDTEVGTSALCPGAVATGLFEAEKNRPEALRTTGTTDEDPGLGTFSQEDDLSPALTPDECGELVIRGILENRAFIFTDPRTKALIERRNERMLADFDLLGAER